MKNKCKRTINKIYTLYIKTDHVDKNVGYKKEAERLDNAIDKIVDLIDNLELLEESKYEKLL